LTVQQAHTDANTAYNFLAAQGPGTVLVAQLDGAVLTSGIYSFLGGAADLANNGTLTLNGGGIFIFQVDSTLTANTGSNVTGTADPCNVFWRVGTSATLIGISFRGNVIADASITVGAGSNVTGRAIAGRGATGAVTMSGAGGNTIGGCASLPNGSNCTSGSDCDSGFCNNMGKCGACSMGGDCGSGSCVAGVCCVPTDPSNCGGDCPAQCAVGKTCTTASDCMSGFCDSTSKCALCASPTDCGGNPCMGGECIFPPILPILHISKTSATTVAPGATLVYTVKYSNSGATATGVMIKETVPDHTTFNAAASTPGWSCPNGSPSGTICTLSVPDLPQGGNGTVLFAVTVDNPPGTTVILNSVLISSAEGAGAGGNATTTVVTPAPAPTLSPWALAALLLLLGGVAYVRLRRA